jgi:hypothetical protein
MVLLDEVLMHAQLGVEPHAVHDRVHAKTWYSVGAWTFARPPQKEYRGYIPAFDLPSETP